MLLCDQIPAVNNLKITNLPLSHVYLKGFPGKNVETKEKGNVLYNNCEPLHHELCRNKDSQVGEVKSNEMQTDINPDKSFDKMAEQEQLVASSEASPSKNNQVKLKLGKPQTSVVVNESTKEAAQAKNVIEITTKEGQLESNLLAESK
ncbi:hypothetical protein HPP92_013084 [Vanilla planifolia]|uniref:Uncharacterized protein n=1 Tax=Vanilla planifolia TaxID=51239 RepID=A0A835QYD5_VANPL|nr:hypothetical protein HPP92_013084 [Vanilla planifolia]